MSAEDWKVEGGHFIAASGVQMRAGCHHRRNHTACGGCYMRLSLALDAIAERPWMAATIVKNVHAAMRADVQPKLKVVSPEPNEGC